MPSPEDPPNPTLPGDWVARVRDDFAETPTVAARILDATRMPRWRGVRLNPLRGDCRETHEALVAAGVELEAVPWRSTLRVTPQACVDAVTSSPAWTEGRVVIQSPTSVLAALALDARAGERVLDLCAAPGGKSGAIAAESEGPIHLVANDRSRRRVHRMRAVFEQLGVEATIRIGPGERLHPRDEQAFDRVLVDAPCSGEGRFRDGDPETFGDWTLRATRRLASTQKALLHAAIAAVRPGGVVVYATCTLGRLENESVVERALARYGEGPTGIELDPLPATIPPGLPLLGDLATRPGACDAIRRWCPDPAGKPWERAMDGFFLARLRRRSGRA